MIMLVAYGSIHHADRELDYKPSVARNLVLFTLMATWSVPAVTLFLFTRKSGDLIILHKMIASCHIFRISKSIQLTPNINALLGILGPQV